MTNDRAGFSELFPHRVCINLDRRPERWERMRTRLSHAGLGAVERFRAVDGRDLQLPPQWPETAGGVGCLPSHPPAGEQGPAPPCENILITADEVGFSGGFFYE